MRLLYSPAFWLFLIGLLRFFEFHSVGTLFAADFATLLALPFAVHKAGRLQGRREIKWLFLFLILWFLGAAVTDAVRGSAWTDLMRGWAKVLMLGVSVFVIAVLSDFRLHRIAAYIAGFAVATLAGVYINPSPYQLAYPWKFGLGLAFGYLAVIIAAFGRTRPYWLRLVLLAAVAVICLMNDARSMFGTAATTILIIMLLEGFPQLRRQAAQSPTLTLLLLAIIAGAMVAVIQTYSHLAGTGALGKEAQYKYAAQTESGNLIVGGRGEFIVSSQAVLDSPIIGHGSWAKAGGYSALLVARLRAQGQRTIYNPRATGDLIPSHSYLMGSWVEHGIFGALFWLYVLWLALRAATRLLAQESKADPLLAYNIIFLLWNVLFSPYGAEVRFIAAAQICLLIAAVAPRATSNDPPRPPSRWARLSSTPAGRGKGQGAQRISSRKGLKVRAGYWRLHYMRTPQERAQLLS